MDYAFKPTTNGRAVIAACGGLSKPFRITRAAVGSGMVPEGVNLADVHELYQYVTEAAISEWRHENDRLYLTIQYANSEHKEQPTFTLSEFIVYAEDPENGGETDLLYATLGDYRQPVPAYNPGIPGSVFSYPMVLVVSDEIEVQVFASPGIVTSDVLENALRAIKAELEESTKIEAEEPPTPETEGQPGQHYFDHKTGREYVCKGTTEDGKYIWEGAATTSDIEQMVSAHNTDPEAHSGLIEAVVSKEVETLTKSGKIVTEDKVTQIAGEEISRHDKDLEAHPAMTARTRGLEMALHGNETLTGEGAPTSETEGKKDQHYIDLTTGEEYVCTEAEDGAYTWKPAEEGTSFMDKIAEDMKISEETSEMLGGAETPNEAFAYLFNQTMQAAYSNLVVLKFTTSGSWTAPSNIVDNKVTVICVGGGGGGAGGNGTDSGGGGGAGGNILIDDLIVTPEESYDYIIGAGGSAGTKGVAGGKGGETTFGELAAAEGGEGGSGKNGGSSKGSGGGGGGGQNGGPGMVGGTGGNGGTYGGGGGAGWGYQSTGGNGGTYGGGGGAVTGGLGGTYGGDAQTDGFVFNEPVAKFFSYVILNTEGKGSGGGGGYGGNGGKNSNGGAGGGGYGGNGGNGGGSSGSYTCGGGGGGGYGGNGGNGGNSGNGGGGGGGGFFANGGDGNGSSGEVGGSGGGGGISNGGAGGSGLIVLIYRIKEG